VNFRAPIIPIFLRSNPLHQLYLAIQYQRDVSPSCPVAGEVIAKSDSYLQ
jgi:hypothetical protein